MGQVTHRYEEATGRYVQMVSPAILRAVLDADGDDYAKPDWMGPEDEWDTSSDLEETES